MKSNAKPGSTAYDWQLIYLARKHPDMPAEEVRRIAEESQTGVLCPTIPEYLDLALKKAVEEFPIEGLSSNQIEDEITLIAVERWLVEHKILPPGDSIGG